MLKRLLLNAETTDTNGGKSGVGIQAPNPMIPQTNIAGTPNDLAGMTNQLVHQLARFDTQSQLKILNAVCVISGIKLNQ